MATSGKWFDWRVLAGVLLLVAGGILGATDRPGPGVILAILGGVLIATTVRSTRKGAASDGRTEAPPPPAP